MKPEPLVFEPPHSEEAQAGMRMLRAIGYQIEWQYKASDPHINSPWRTKDEAKCIDQFFDFNVYRAVPPK